jgi:hypothetical protein
VAIPARIAQPSRKKLRKTPRKIPSKPEAAAAGAGKACSDRPRPKPSGRPRKIRPIVGPCSLQLHAATMQFHQTHTIRYQLLHCQLPAAPRRCASGCRVCVAFFRCSPVAFL